MLHQCTHFMELHLEDIYSPDSRVKNQSQLIQYHPNQSTIDGAGETLTKKQKVKHAASMHTFHGAASGRYIQEKISPDSRVKNRT